jgi:MFS transporter, UMF1 family
MATTYGGEVGIDSTLMIAALLLTQIIAFPFAILAGVLAKKHGPIKLIKIYILIYIFIAIFGFQLDKAWEFWFLAVMVALAQGGVQSLSRSYFGKIVPKNESNEYFGFFDIFGKFADFFGPLILTFTAIVLGSSRYGILALIILFIVGYWMISKVEKIDNAAKLKDSY